MNKKDVSDKIKKDLVIIEDKLLNHCAFKEHSILLQNEADDVRSLTRTYLDMLCGINFEANEDDYNYCIQRQEAINKIYEQIKIRSEYYLKEDQNQFYKKIIDAFNNVIRIYDCYDGKIEKMKSEIYKKRLDDYIDARRNEILYISVKWGHLLSSIGPKFNIGDKFIYRGIPFEVDNSIEYIWSAKLKNEQNNLS